MRFDTALGNKDTYIIPTPRGSVLGAGGFSFSKGGGGAVCCSAGTFGCGFVRAAYNTLEVVGGIFPTDDSHARGATVGSRGRVGGSNIWLDLMLSCFGVIAGAFVVFQGLSVASSECKRSSERPTVAHGLLDLGGEEAEVILGAVL
jgi:hypothetical protein